MEWPLVALVVALWQHLATSGARLFRNEKAPVVVVL